MTPIDDFSFPSRIRQLARVGSRATDERIAELRREGREVLALTAYPGRSLPEAIAREAAAHIMHRGHPPARGLPGLRRALAAYWTGQSARELDPESEILITAGTMHALICVMMAVLDPGDEVLLFTPSYFFDGTITLAGGVIKPVPLDETDGFAWRVERLERAIGPRTRAILLNTPSNPTGFVASRDCMEAIAEIAQRRRLFLICDESYDRLVYDGGIHTSILGLKANRERNILAASFTKSFGLANWRVGYLIAAPAVINAALKVFEWTMLFGPYLNQKVAELVLTSDRSWLDGVREEFQDNRDRFAKTLAEAPHIKFVLPRGNPFFFLNVSHGGRSDEEAARMLLEEHGTPCTAGVLHGAPGFVRVAFGGEPEVVAEAANRIARSL